MVRRGGIGLLIAPRQQHGKRPVMLFTATKSEGAGFSARRVSVGNPERNLTLTKFIAECLRDVIRNPE